MPTVPNEIRYAIKTYRLQNFGYKRIATLLRQNYGYAASRTTIRRYCDAVAAQEDISQRRPGSGRPKSAFTEDNEVASLALSVSQEDAPHTSKSSRRLVKEGDVSCSRSTVIRIFKKYRLQSFKRIKVQRITAETGRKRLDRARALLRRFRTPESVGKVAHSDEKCFYLNDISSNQNDRVRAAGLKRSISNGRLLVQRDKFGKKVMVSAAVCFRGKSRLIFVDPASKVNTRYYIDRILPVLKLDLDNMYGDADYIFQQDGAPSHTAAETQTWLRDNFPDFISKDQWPPNSPDLNVLDYCVWGMLTAELAKISPRATTLDQLRANLLIAWDKLSLDPIRRALLKWPDRLRTVVEQNGQHIEHLV